MKKCLPGLSGLLAAFVFISCSKNADNGDQSTPPPPVGVVTAIGQSLREPVASKTIGAAGGNLLSKDGRLRIEVPAGALTSDQEVRIEAISDENPMGSQKAYRLAPHGVTFQKPVTLTFFYEEEDHRHSAPEALAIATQDADRIWQIQSGAQLNKNQNSLSVTTTHFSDWSFFESFRVEPVSKVVTVNSTVALKVTSIADMFVPLTPGQQVPVGEPVSPTAEFIKKWTLTGAGNLQGQGANATYKAPATVPGSPNPVVVSVEVDLKRRGKYVVLAYITIQNDDGEIEVSVAGGPWRKKLASPAVKFADNIYGFGDSDGDDEGSYVFVMWEGGAGSHGFKQPQTPLGTHAQFQITGGLSYAPYFVTAAEELQVSGGGVTISSMGEDDGYIKGTFEVAQAGISPDLKQTTSISGKFRVKKGW